MFVRGQCYRLNEDPETLYTVGLKEFAGQVVLLKKFEDLHNGTRGARVLLPDGTGAWVALQDLTGDNILWDTYSSLLQGLSAVWQAGVVQSGHPLEHATQMVGAALQFCHHIPAGQVGIWLSAVLEEK